MFHKPTYISTILLISSLLAYFPLSAQLGGNAVFPFLKLDPSAKAASMGGTLISLSDCDLSTALTNPATVTDKYDNNIALNYNNYFKDINYGHVAYAKRLGNKEKGWMLSSQVLYLNYGTFDGYDYTGESTGSFKANDLMIGMSASKSLNEKFNYGGTFKFIYSTLETYTGTGVAFDFGGFYHDTSKGLSFGLAARNIGYQLLSYRGTERAPLPFDLNFAGSIKPKHAPFRITILLHDLQKRDLTYDYTDPFNRKIDENNQVISKKPSLADKIIRHINVGGEILLSENFNIRFGYNHQRRQELGTVVKKGVAGFSWGFAFKIKKIGIEYGSAGFFPGYNSNLFSVIINLNEFYH
ncbi:MAG: type IX secretion system protein PorQ [Bacteroidetes bacterium]|nr:type IX secretion system protein PorQ [Bacteroidota bacterium]